MKTNITTPNAKTNIVIRTDQTVKKHFQKTCAVQINDPAISNIPAEHYQ